jgi:excisionase family DNA binding protein
MKEALQQGATLLSRREVAQLIGVHYESVGRWERAGKLPAYKIGSKCTRYRREDVEAFLADGYIQRDRS